MVLQHCSILASVPLSSRLCPGPGWEGKLHHRPEHQPWPQPRARSRQALPVTPCHKDMAYLLPAKGRAACGQVSASRHDASTALNSSQCKGRAECFQDILFECIVNIVYKPSPNLHSSCRDSRDEGLCLSCCCQTSRGLERGSTLAGQGTGSLALQAWPTRWADVLRRTTGPKVWQVKEGGSATRESHHNTAKAFWSVTLSLCEVKMSCTHLHLLGTVLVGAYFQGAYRWCSLAKCTSSSGGFVVVAVGVVVVFGDDNFFFFFIKAYLLQKYCHGNGTRRCAVLPRHQLSSGAAATAFTHPC